jgi:hypothetical protein
VGVGLSPFRNPPFAYSLVFLLCMFRPISVSCLILGLSVDSRFWHEEKKLIGRTRGLFPLSLLSILYTICSERGTTCLYAIVSPYHVAFGSCLFLCCKEVIRPGFWWRR